MLSIFVFLFCIWLIFSGYFKAFFLVSGILSCFLVYIISKQQNLILFRASYAAAKYIIWLFYQMILSSWQVTKLIWQRQPQIITQIKKIPHEQNNAAKVAILAHSITLTPGTLTIYQDDEYLYVHALSADYLTGIDDIKQHIPSDKKIAASK